MSELVENPEDRFSNDAVQFDLLSFETKQETLCAASNTDADHRVQLICVFVVCISKIRLSHLKMHMLYPNWVIASLASSLSLRTTNPTWCLHVSVCL